MGPTRAGVPVTSCAERIPLRDPPQGKSRAANTLACCPAAGFQSHTTQAYKKLPLGELKILFYKFLEQQGYALPSEVDSVLELESSDSTINNNTSSSGQLPCPSICSSGKRSSSAISSDEGSYNSNYTIKGSDNEESDFQIVQRKIKRVARRLRKFSSSQSNDSVTETEQGKMKSTIYTDSSPASRRPRSKMTSAL
ncbi:hypothetical protein EVAR_22844_1 [Eumeta japonica]|uniref:Uncharacterized protein n=1 Tax=Eumeta variegata TaxID=151549 RepID=A0A4C1VGC0_EUMVA|nr:hypothetical protein EVAR_22844_1 [Eumeta japonica]